MAIGFGDENSEASGFGVRFLAFLGFSLRIQDISNSNDVVVRISNDSSGNVKSSKISSSNNVRNHDSGMVLVWRLK